MKQLAIFFFTITFCLTARSQPGGRGVYAFVNQSVSARIMSMGGGMLAIQDNDITLPWLNPALLNKSMDKHGSMNFNTGYSKIKGGNDIKNGYFAYSRNYKKIGTFSAGLLYMNYGTFNGYDPNGDPTGTFKATDNCLNISLGRQYKTKWSYGASLKYVYSVLGEYISNGIGVDLGGIYADTAQKLTIGLVVKNMGVQFVPYAGTKRQGMPFEIQVAISKKLKHLPLLYNIVIHDLQSPDFRYVNTNSTSSNLDANNKPKIQKMTMGDNILRHFILGGEFNIKSFNLRFGYNHQRRKELAPEIRRSTTGFCWGVGIKISKFRLSYGSAAYFPGINSNQFSIAFNLADFKRNKKG
ncbi:MAG: type IX secretion system protein PorQ [Bacteroidia bacterium]|nr:type IX secretion system protein PorQ [Bacteroidia bacterium]